MNMFGWLSLSVLVVSIFTSTAFAACRRANVCDDYGQNCRYEDICDSTIDLPSVELDPLPALPSMQVKPLPSIGLPPLGTTKCEYKQVNGQWQNICQ